MTEVFMRVKGMMQQGGFTWVGCPDAVRAELANLSGLAKVEYLVDRDLFAVEYDPDRVSLETIFTAVWMAGRNTGREFIPELVT